MGCAPPPARTSSAQGRSQGLLHPERAWTGQMWRRVHGDRPSSGSSSVLLEIVCWQLAASNLQRGCLLLHSTARGIGMCCADERTLGMYLRCARSHTYTVPSSSCAYWRGTHTGIRRRGSGNRPQAGLWGLLPYSNKHSTHPGTEELNDEVRDLPTHKGWLRTSNSSSSGVCAPAGTPSAPAPVQWRVALRACSDAGT